jgi:hypothetical protein
MFTWGIKGNAYTAGTICKRSYGCFFIQFYSGIHVFTTAQSIIFLQNNPLNFLGVYRKIRKENGTREAGLSLKKIRQLCD